MSNESALWKFMKKNVDKYGHWVRIESHATADGIPDVDFCVKGIEGKIELKHCPTDTIPSRFIRKSQVRWITTRVNNGGNVWIFAKIGKTYYLVNGTQIKYLNGSTSVLTWRNVAHRTWEHMDWDEFIRMIATGIDL